METYGRALQLPSPPSASARLSSLKLTAPFVAFAIYALLRSDLRTEHILVIGIVATLASVGPRTKELLHGLYPLGFVFMLYDGMRPYQKLGLTESSVHVCDVRALEA